MASVASAEHHHFGPFELQPDKRRLLKDGTAISLRPRAFDLLVALVDRAGHLISKDELLDQVWPKLVVEEAALHVQVSALRKVLGGDAISTVSGRGYQFTLAVTKGDSQADRASRSKHNLPYQLTSFIGREQEIEQLKELVTANRLVTLTGAGGAGKSRLAIEVSSRLVDAFADGVWLVELAALSDPHLVPQAAAQALEVKEQPTRPLIETLSDCLASKKLLLVLDNAEHLLDGCVQFVDLVLRRSPDVAILVTSRERLGMAGELTLRVPSLTVPATNETLMPETVSGYEGVRLFVERAKLARADFELTAENAPSVASICARLDGMPLAIELAAPRLRSMSVDELNERLDQRFALLTDGSRAALPRHRTLRSVLDWSYDLLNEREQAMLRRVAVFAGGWTLASAEQVCTGGGIDASDAFERLTSLVDKSLFVTDEQAGATRYRMLETVRQYALDRLRESGEEAQWRARHLSCFLALAEKLSARLHGPDMKAGVDRLASEQDNFRAALGWCCACRAEEGLRLAAALISLWRIRALVEGREWCSRVLDAAPIGLAMRDRARVLFDAALLALHQGDYAAAKALFEQSLALCREIDEQTGIVHALSGLANVALLQADYAEAETRCRTALASSRGLEDQGLITANLDNLAIAVNARGDWDAARALFDEAQKLARETGDPERLGSVLNDLGQAGCDHGHHELARACFAESITMLKDVGHHRLTAEAMEGFAAVALATGSPSRGVRLLAAADVLREGSQARSYEVPLSARVNAARASLGDAAFEQAWAEGRAMTLDDAVRYALDEQAGRDT